MNQKPWDRGDPAPTPENVDATLAGIESLFQIIGIDPRGPNVAETPQRFLVAMAEMTAGYAEDPEEILDTLFDWTSTEMVVLRRVDFVSLCEHHLLPFIGHATVAYIPRTKLLGVSKLARLVACFARRLQIQERLTVQVADALAGFKPLNPEGVAVIVTARHTCMGCRGVRQPGSEMVTSALRGCLADEPAARAELLRLHDGP